MRYLLILSCFLALTAQAQETVKLKPDSICGKDAPICNSDAWTSPPPLNERNYKNAGTLRTEGWTAFANGSPQHDWRSLISFEELSLFDNATIQSAVLRLFESPNYPNSNGGQFGDNSVAVFRIVSPWEEDQLTWLNQPNVDSNSVVYIPTNNNYTSIDVDVTNMVSAMLQNPTSNFGFMLSQVNEDPYSSMNFASSDHPDSDLWPELIIVYDADVNSFAESPPLFSFSDTLICPGDVLNLDVSIPGALSYVWSDGQTSPEVTFTQAGSYSVTVTGSCFNLSDTISLDFLNDVAPAFLLEDTILCEGDSLSVALNLDPGFSISWSNGQTTPNLTLFSAGLYTVTVTGACAAASDTFNLQFKNLSEQAPLSFQDTSICADDSLHLDLSYLPGELTAWSTGVVSDSISLPVDGLYSFEKRDYENCNLYTQNFFVSDADCPLSCPVEFPNAFTPNNDGTNDQFRPIMSPECTMAFQVYDFRIYNRWGEEVYVANRASKSWDGFYEGRESPADVYTYILTAQLEESDEILRWKGDFTLIR